MLFFAVHDRSTKNYGPHYKFISVICTRHFDQNIWSSFFCIFFLGSSTISSFYFHTTVRPNYMVLFHLFFLLCTTIRPRVRVLSDLFLLFAYDHSTKIYDPLLFFILYTTIRPKIGVLIDLFLSCAHNHLTEIYGFLIFISSSLHDQSTKLRVFTYLFFLT